ncbi:MAG: ferritin [Planctomycetota bacterium]|jgi:ferritin
MIDPKLEEAINLQINKELTASYNYLSMAAWLDDQNLGGFSGFMERQSQEERDHAHRLFRYLLDRSGKVDLRQINQPPQEFDSVRQVFELSLEAEVDNTRAINLLYETARDLNDYATLAHLQWFLDEQVEEEKTMNDVLGKLTMASNDTAALLMLDKLMGEGEFDGDGGGA